GTVPGRGLYGVYAPEGSRVGELDEEMVYESRVGETFVLGATTWRIEEITRDRVVVTPAPGEPGKMPFWHGDGLGRPVELGRAIGAFLRDVDSWDDARLADECSLDELAVRNLRSFLAEQRDVTGVVPNDREIVVERFRDELGDCRAGDPARARRCGSSASGRPTCSRSRRSTARSRSCSRPTASACATSSTCPPWSSSCVTFGRGACASCRSTPFGRRRSRPRS